MVTHGAAVGGAAARRPPRRGTRAPRTWQPPHIGHDHHHHGDPGHRDRSRDARALGLVLALTAGFAVAELVGGLLSGSVALLADAAHMASDSASLALALGAVWLARRAPTARMSFGWRRAEILAALANGVALVALGIWVIVEAAGRLPDPPDIDAPTVLAIGLAGLAVNVAGAAVLWRSGGTSLNVRAALAHVLADLLGSLGVVVAAALVLAAGWLAADPVAGLVIGALVLLGSWRVLRESVAVLLEAAPEGVDVEGIGRRMAAAPGVREVHDLHVWTITSGFPALSAHVLVDRAEDCHARRRELARMLESEFDIRHTTLQVEHAQGEARLHGLSDRPTGPPADPAER
jgi:cobalt-zinc-cadmium efflux system protein